MNEKEIWINKKLLYSKIFLTAGLLALITGISQEATKVFSIIDPRLVTGSGILLLGLSFSNWLRYSSARKDPRAINAEIDERMRIIRTRSGNRGFWISITITYALLMWESISSNGSLPLLSDNARWYWLAAAVVIPFITYIASIVYDETHF